MNLAALRRLLASKPSATECQPFGPDVLVYKVGQRMFALVTPGYPIRLTLKLEPLHGQLLRAQNSSVTPGYHMNKEHWNTVVLNALVADDELLDWIDESYALVVARLPRRVRKSLSGQA
jgi:predicted DNA-binding protein (MmcQ/YjbR family)